MAYEVRTAVFEGPLDLLLQLITRHQVDVTEISLGALVKEYLSFIDAMRDMDLDVTSEFLLIASTLIQLKARQLLPSGADVDLDEELALMEERDRLLSRLLACVTFKDVAAVLGMRLRDGARHLPRTLGITDEVGPRVVDVRVPVDAAGLRDLADAVLTRSTEPDLDHLDLDLPSVEVAIEDLRRRITADVTTTFDAVAETLGRRVEVVAYFLALLELARWGVVEVSQEDWMSDIHITRVAP
jgi:segregation and condensation protein A